MSKPLFACCTIARNEIKTLPKLRESLEPFIQRGGKCYLLDTGSTDGTADLARQLGFIVKEVGEKFLVEVTNYMAINQKFIAEGEKAIIKKGDKYFDFAKARNCLTEFTEENVCFWYDADEASIAMDIDFINKTIEDGYTQWEYFFTFAFDQFGNEAVKFVQCKAYDKRVMRWDGRVHELVINIDNNNPGKRIFLNEQQYKLAHYQNHETGRHSYSIGLAVDCFEFPNNDRHQFYLSREMLYHNRPKSALKGFKQHLRMGGWHSERSESLIHCGDIYGMLNDPTNQMLSYAEAFHTDSGRNAALVKLALYYRHNKNAQAAICYAKAALEIPYSGFYADNLANYREIPHEILYQSYGQCPNIPGYIEKAQEHLNKALEFQPYNQQYLNDTKIYFEFGAPMIDGWMRWPEIKFLFEEAQKHEVIVEIGSWKGRSTTAICTGQMKGKPATGTTFAVDTWQGSSDERDLTNTLAKQEDVFATFMNNTKQFGNLTPIRKTSVEAANDFEDNSIDWVFIDAGHTKEEVREDVLAWLPKVKCNGIISGHDYQESWMGVIAAVDEKFGKGNVNVVDSIWWVNLERIKNPDGTFGVSGLSGVQGGYASSEGHPDPVGLSEEECKIISAANEKKTELIPRKVFTCWLGENMPDLVKRCIESQKAMCEKFGYEFQLLTLQNIPIGVSGIEYLNQAVNSSHPNGVKYCKATDYLRWLMLYNEGGIFLDSDVMVQDGKDFGEMLGDKMFIGLESADWANGKVVLGTAVLGAVAGHPFMKWILNEVDTRFRGDTADNYESSMALLNTGGVNFQDQFTLYEPEYFFPKNSYTGELDSLTEKTICVHEFTKLWTPETNAPKSTLQQFKYNIENNINFTFVKRGDGEVACMNGEQGANCDGHPYSKELGDKLREAYGYLEASGSHIVDFDDQVNYNVLLHRTDNNLQELSEFYKAIAKSERNKVFIGPKRLQPIADLFNAEQVEIPELNMYASYDDVFKRLQDPLEYNPYYENAIFIFCAGMPAKVLIADLHKILPSATYLDCGSAFDPSFSETRTWQITKEQFWELYKPIELDVKFDSSSAGNFQYAVVLDYEKKDEESELVAIAGEFWKSEANKITNNFNLPQETHPERFWVISQMDEPDNKDRVMWDLGCGTNKTTEACVGVDIRPVTDITASIDELPCPTNGPDTVISRHSFEHLLDPAKAMKEWIRVLKPGGKIIFVLPDHEFINTLDNYYSAGQHLHAYTRESFKNFLSLFTELSVSKTETVLKDWSFGTVVYKLPRVTFLIPHIDGTREEGLAKCKESIQRLNYPAYLRQVLVIGGPETVPEKITEGLRMANGDIICYCANDMEFTPDAVRIAVTDMLELNKGLVSFNEGNILPDRGNECTHFVISKELISKLERGELFSLDLNHVGVDNFLVAQAEKLNQYHHCKDARIIHNHFSNGNEFDETYQRGWSHVEQDRETLRQKLLSLESK